MKKDKICIILIFFLSLIGCSNKKSVSNKIRSAIDKCDSQPNCIISIKDITNFSWDTLYVIENSVQWEEIKNITACNNLPYSEFTDKLIFKSNRQLAYYEEMKVEVSKKTCNALYFQHYAENYNVYTPENAKFKGTKNEDSGCSTYSMIQQ